jgi:drug/metabolite transporter (DMT)-like permease
MNEMTQPDEAARHSSDAPPTIVPPTVIKRLILGLTMAYGLDFIVAGLIIVGWSTAGQQTSAIAFAAGHGLALLIGMSWVMGTVFSTNRSPTAVMASTMLLVPLRYVGGIITLVALAAYFDDAALTVVMVFSFLFTQIFNHILHSITCFVSSEYRLVPDAPLESPDDKSINPVEAP